MLLAIHLGVGVRECLVLATIFEYGLASSLNVAKSIGFSNTQVISLINILRSKNLVFQHGIIDTFHPRPVGRPSTVKLWCLSEAAKVKIIEWDAGKRQAAPAAVKRRKRSS
jgi:hypothetical protein